MKGTGKSIQLVIMLEKQLGEQQFLTLVPGNIINCLKLNVFTAQINMHAKGDAKRMW